MHRCGALHLIQGIGLTAKIEDKVHTAFYCNSLRLVVISLHSNHDIFWRHGIELPSRRGMLQFLQEAFERQAECVKVQVVYGIEWWAVEAKDVAFGASHFHHPLEKHSI